MPLSNFQSYIIRRYRSEDRGAVRRICCKTALMGEPSSAFFDDDEIFADALTSYFTDYEPDSCFVAEYNNEVVGYLTGAGDSRRMDRVFAANIAMPLFMKALTSGTFFSVKSIKFLLHVFLSLIKGEFRTPDFSGDYPALLHINIVKDCRLGGIGSKLMGAYLDHLRAIGVKGVRCATMSEKGGRFFSKFGFQLLFEGRRSYFRHFLKQDVPVYIYGMRILPFGSNRN